MAKNHGFLDGEESIEQVYKALDRVDDHMIGEGVHGMRTEERKYRVKYADLFPCPKNAEMSKPQEKIEALADSIAREGLLAPLVVAQRDGGKYEILSGETRYLAIGLLRERGMWNPEDTVEVNFFDASTIDIPLSDGMKEDYVRRTANIMRDKTGSDYCVEIREWSDMIDVLKKNGVEFLSAPGTDGEEHGIRISGAKKADIISQIIGMSARQVNNYLRVENTGTDELKRALLGDAMSADTAAAATRSLSEKGQEQFAAQASEKKNSTGKRATKTDLEEFEKAFEGKKAKKEPEEKQDLVCYNKDSFCGDIQPLMDLFEDNQGFFMTEDAHVKVLKNIATIQKILAQHIGK